MQRSPVRKHNVLNHYHTTYISFRRLYTLEFLLFRFFQFSFGFRSQALTLILHLLCTSIAATGSIISLVIFYVCTNFQKSVHFYEICFGLTSVRFNAAKKVFKEKLSTLKIRRCVILNLFHNLLFNCQFLLRAHIVLFLFRVGCVYGFFSSLMGRSTTFSRFALIRIQVCTQYILVVGFYVHYIYSVPFDRNICIH